MKVILMKKKELESLMNEYDDLGIEVIKGYLFEKYVKGIRYIENLIEEKWDELLKKENPTEDEEASIDVAIFVKRILSALRKTIEEAKKEKADKIEFMFLTRKISLLEEAMRQKEKGE